MFYVVVSKGVTKDKCPEFPQLKTVENSQLVAIDPPARHHIIRLVLSSHHQDKKLNTTFCPTYNPLAQPVTRPYDWFGPIIPKIEIQKDWTLDNVRLKMNHNRNPTTKYWTPYELGHLTRTHTLRLVLWVVWSTEGSKLRKFPRTKTQGV